MSGRLLDKYTGRMPDAPASDGPVQESDATDDLGAFGWLRGIRDRAMMLELRKKTGESLAIPYGWIERVLFDPSDGITIHAGGQKVRLKGRNLNAEQRGQGRLFEGVTRGRVAWIQEADEPANLQASNGATVVERIEW